MDAAGDAVKLLLEAARAVARIEVDHKRLLEEAANVEREIAELEDHLLPQLKKRLEALSAEAATLAKRIRVGSDLLYKTAENAQNAKTTFN